MIHSPASPTFQIVDETAEREDLARRKEMKFTFAHADVDRIRRVLEVSCRQQIFADRVSCVRSVYFDDARLSCLRANLDGIGQRQKLRLRWYDAPLPAGDAVVEIKWRNNRLTGKHRFLLHSRQPLLELSYRQIQRELERTLPAAFAPVIVRYSEPIVLVEYRRQHFRLRESGVRLTIDYDLAYYDQTGRPAISNRFRQPVPNLVVIEGKTSVGEEQLLRRVLTPLVPRVDRCSKYVRGCRMLGLWGDHS